MTAVKIMHSTTPGNKPASLLTGQLAINEADRALYYLDPVAAAPASLLDQLAALNAYNNLIINGAIEVDQINRGNALTGITATTSYTADMVKLVTSGAQVFTYQQVTDAPPGFNTSAKFAVTTANASPGATDNARIVFPIEGTRVQRLLFGTASAQNVAVGFWVKAFRAGVYGVSLTNAANNRNYTTSFTINATATWQYVTLAIPGDVTGTWVTGSALSFQMAIWLMAGTAFQTATVNQWSASSPFTPNTQINGVQSTSDVLQIGGVSMHAGYVMPIAARSPSLQLQFFEASILCQRYWQKSYDYNDAVGAVTNVNGWEFFISANAGTGAASVGVEIRHVVPMMATPTIAFFSSATGTSGKVRDLTNGADVNCAVGSLSNGSKGFIATMTQSAANTAWSFRGHHTADARM